MRQEVLPVTQIQIKDGFSLLIIFGEIASLNYLLQSHCLIRVVHLDQEYLYLLIENMAMVVMQQIIKFQFVTQQKLLNMHRLHIILAVFLDR